MPDILLAEDDRVIREGLKALLSAEGYAVRAAKDGDDALRRFAERRPDLVLLDVMMPRMNGFRACEEIRRIDPVVPILFLTAKDSDADQVRGIGLGADDYVSKAAPDAVLLARIRRALDRAATSHAAVCATRTDTDVLHLGTVTIDFRTLRVSCPDSPDETLTRTECVILRALAARRGEFVANDDLFNAIHGVDYVGDVSKVRSHLSNLKRKLGPAADMLANKPGVGYMLLP